MEGEQKKKNLAILFLYKWSAGASCLRVEAVLTGLPFCDHIPRHHQTLTFCFSGPLNYNQRLTLSFAAWRVFVQASRPSLVFYFIIHKVGIERKP